MHSHFFKLDQCFVKREHPSSDELVQDEKNGGSRALVFVLDDVSWPTPFSDVFS